MSDKYQDYISGMTDKDAVSFLAAQCRLKDGTIERMKKELEEAIRRPAIADKNKRLSPPVEVL